MKNLNGTILLFLLIVVVYIPSLSCGYIVDDDVFVVANEHLRTVEGLKEIWFNPSANQQYYPLTFSSLWINYFFDELNPFGYHLVNILFHAANSIILWRLLAFMGIPGAWLAGAIFGVHPVHVESVTWVFERKNVLSGFFYLLSFFCYIKFAVNKQNIFNFKYYFISFFLFICALLSKTVTVTLPAVILLFLWWKNARLSKKDVLRVIPFFLAGISLGLLTVSMEVDFVGANKEEWGFTFIERILIAGRAIWFYMGKIVWPYPLVFIYPGWDIDHNQWQQYLFPGAFLVTAFLLWKFKELCSRGPLFGFLFFVGTLFPALGFFNLYIMRISFVADHFQYLASLGIIVLISAGLWKYLGPTIKKPFGVAILVILSFVTWNEQSHYQSQETLWKGTIEKNPDCWMAYFYLGVDASAKNDIQAALGYYRKAIDLKEDYVNAMNNYANLLIKTNKYSEAKKYLERALKINESYEVPDQYYLSSLNLMASIQVREGDFKSAAAKYTLVINNSPPNLFYYHIAHAGLAGIYLKLNKLEKALEHSMEALEKAPNDISIHINLGLIYFQQKNYSKSLDEFKYVLTQNPKSTHAYYYLGHIFKIKGDTERAKQYYQKVIELNDYKVLSQRSRESIQNMESSLSTH